MTIIAALLAFAVAVAGLVIACFIAYWVLMAMLIVLGLVFAFWTILFVWIFSDIYVAELCALFATGITIFFWGHFDRKKAKR